MISKGDLDHIVPVKTDDELGTLSKAFNDMTSRIRSILKTKEQLLLDVSHELRSPLTRMKVSFEFLDDGDIKNSLKDDLVEMEKMVTEILETARLRDKSGQMNKKPHDIVKILYETAESFMGMKPGLNLKCSSDQIIFSFDEDRIETVIRNILSNAFKFSGKNSPPVDLSIIEKKGHISITIKDSGIGIPAEALPHLFEPFYRVDSSRTKEISGYGLGLGLCKTIMDAHGGSIRIESNDQGTNVFLMLPTT